VLAGSRVDRYRAFTWLSSAGGLRHRRRGADRSCAGQIGVGGNP